MFLLPTYVGCTARICRLYGLQAWAVQPSCVGYKLITVKVGLSSHDYRIYTGSLQQKQAILCI